jgi:hypothetical protein
MVVCPMDVAIKWSGQYQCIQGDCAWYDRTTGECAVLTLAQTKVKEG